ncbi:MAG: ROK family protein [Spirochaetaceae bacterium]|jgi:predicted NBD/HSP70 family sugar kinase|nr:ROK family protein [Spirochaetaceae bacterium]
MNKYVIDIGATNTKFALMSAEGEMQYRRQVPTVYTSKEAYFENLVSLIGEHPGKGDGIAVSTNGRMDVEGNTYRAYTMDILRGVNLKAELEGRTGLAVSVLNDGFSAALGEWWKGAGRGSKNCLTVVLGSGMGGGLILEGELYQGSRRNAAMLFFMLNGYDGVKSEMCALSTSFSLVLYQLSAIKQIPMTEMSGEKFFEFLARGDGAARNLLDKYNRDIAAVVYNAAMLLDLDRVVISGGLSERDEIITGINENLRDIPGRAFAGMNSDFLGTVLYDEADLQVRVTKGELAQDANLYGALYYMLRG